MQWRSKLSKLPFQATKTIFAQKGPFGKGSSPISFWEAGYRLSPIQHDEWTV
jgi:hypothetical protein